MESTQIPREQELPGDSSLPSSAEELAQLMEAAEGPFKYDVEDFFRNPEKTAFQISPDGNYISYLGPYERRQNIFVQPIEGGEAIRITHETDRDIGGYFWSGNRRIVFVKDSGGDENFRLYAVDRDGSHPKDLTPFEKVRIQIIDDLEEVPDELIIGMNKNRPDLFEPYRIHIRTGEFEQLAVNDNPLEPISAWITDHAGRLRAAIRIIGGVNQQVLYRPDENDPFKVVITTNFRETMAPLFFDFDDGHVVYAASNLGRDKSAIVKFDMETGEEIGDPIFSHPEVDVSNLLYSKKRKVITGVSYLTWKREMSFFDEKRRKIQESLDAKLSGYEAVVTDTDKAEETYLVRTYSDRSLGAYYIYKVAEDHLSKITDVSPWLSEKDMAPMKPVTLSSRDGLTLHGYLTLPLNQEAEGLPIVVNPHGGPWARDGWGYNPEIQLLVSRGFGVFQINFRGSTGYGRAFWESSFKQWGQSMQDDITDGVRWLIGQGIADPDRIAIYGGSYGGYATLAGITFTPDLYACAIDYVGVSNLFTFMQTIPPYWKPYLDMLYEMVGNPEKDKEMMRANSPVFHIERIKAPLFVVQGANDPRVNIDEADQIVRRLRERGIEVPYMVKYNEGHGFANEENRFAFYKAMTGFLLRHLHPAKKGEKK